MKTASIRDLRHDTTTVLGWVADGQTVEIRRRGKPVAILSGVVDRPKSIERPDFEARHRKIFGKRRFPITATELIHEERGDR